MGKWSAAHYDSVLSAKIKSLVSGAITRAKLEEIGPNINYETFVRELDPGDSFTTSVIEILVQELAERRNRTSVSDKRLIGDRTAKYLRSLALPGQIYRDSRVRRIASRRNNNLVTEYLASSPPREMDLEEDDIEFDSMLAQPGQPIAEGIRINSELFEAYGSWGGNGSPSYRRSRTASPTPPSGEENLVSRTSLRSPPMPNRTSFAPPPSSSLTRQPSIRRHRSRAVDFNEFTYRRRHTLRDSLREPGIDRNDDSTESTRDSSSWTRPQATRRFFTLNRPLRREPPSWLSPSTYPPPLTDGIDTPDDPTPIISAVEPSPSSAAWYPFSGPSNTLSHDGSGTETSDERTVTLPRLRRGGIRAPESLVSGQPSLNEISSIVRLPISPSLSDSAEHIVPVSGNDVAAYPTPGPLSPRHENS